MLFYNDLLEYINTLPPNSGVRVEELLSVRQVGVFCKIRYRGVGMNKRHSYPAFIDAAHNESFSITDEIKRFINQRPNEYSDMVVYVPMNQEKWDEITGICELSKKHKNYHFTMEKHCDRKFLAEIYFPRDWENDIDPKLDFIKHHEDHDDVILGKSFKTRNRTCTIKTNDFVPILEATLMGNKIAQITCKVESLKEAEEIASQL